jgi:glycosyltransferase involved in cell wall biosynthesis
MKKPLVSVVIPTIPSREQLLKRAIKSVKSQTYQNIEILPVTEGNNACEARNIGISKAKGEFIAFLDDDDTWEPTKIEKQVHELLSHPWCPLCITYSHDLRFNQDRINKPPRVITHREIIKSFNLSSTSSYLVRKYALVIIRKLDGHYFDESLKSAHEYDLAIRITREGHDVITVEEPLITQYSTDDSISENWGNKISGIMRIYTKHHKDYQMFDHIKTVGLLGLFLFGYIFGNKIYRIIVPIKELYENV